MVAKSPNFCPCYTFITKGSKPLKKVDRKLTVCKLKASEAFIILIKAIRHIQSFNDMFVSKCNKFINILTKNDFLKFSKMTILLLTQLKRSHKIWRTSVSFCTLCSKKFNFAIFRGDTNVRIDMNVAIYV